MDRNRKILLFCGMQMVIYLIFLSVLLLHWQNRVRNTNGIAVVLWGTMIFLVLVGCALTLVILDYIREVVRFPAVIAFHP